MAWQDEMIPMLRALINDWEPTHEYSDARLESLLCVAAHYSISDVSFETTYTISVSDTSISPDPTTDNDTTFINLVVLKAACIIDKGNMRLAAMTAGLKATCGPAVMDTLSRMPGFSTLIDKGYCASYEELSKQIAFGDTRLIRAIMSPFTNSNFDPSIYVNLTQKHTY